MKTLMLLSNGYNPDVRVEKEARSLAEAGHYVEIFAWDRDGHKDQLELDTRRTITIKRSGPRSTYRSKVNVIKLPIFWFKVYWHVLQSDADVIHCHDFDTFPPGLFAAKLRLRPKKVIYDAHENYGALHPKTKHFVNFFEKLFCRFSSVITVNELLAKRYKKSTVVMNCPRLSDYLKEYNQESPTRFTIAYIGGLQEGRGLEVMVKAMSELPDAILKLYGRGSLYLEPTTNVELCGYIEPNEVAKKTCEASMLFALYEAGGNNNFASPNKLFDAMAAGKPILVSDVGIMGDFVRKYEMGVVLKEITSDSVVNGVMKIRQNYDKFANNALQASKDYNWNNESKKLLEVYNKNDR